MHPRFARERRYRLATRAVLILGLSAAVLAYFIAATRPENPLGDPLDNKKYIHDLQLYGGTANVLAAEFREWIAGLWFGKNLAYTLAVLTLMLAGLVRFLAIPPLREDEPERGDARPKPKPPRSAACWRSTLTVGGVAERFGPSARGRPPAVGGAVRRTATTRWS